MEMNTRIDAAEARCGPEQTNNNERSRPDLQIRWGSHGSTWSERIVSQRRTSLPLGGISNVRFPRSPGTEQSHDTRFALQLHSDPHVDRHCESSSTSVTRWF